jgi:xanthine dehydrogenase accessory factor
VAALDSLAAVLGRGASSIASVVASQGHYDEEALETILKSGAATYVGLVASRKRGGTIIALLQQSGVPRVDTIRNPAGLDLGARTPGEVALSVLAEIVQQQPSGAVVTPTPGASADTAAAVSATATDPVCGMEVVIAAARHQAELDGTTYYFCCPHCRAHFLRDPQAWLAARS